MKNLDYIKRIQKQRQLTHAEIAELSGYSLGHVRAWFVKPSSSRFRPVPTRAVTIIQLKLKDSQAPSKVPIHSEGSYEV